MPFGRGYGRRRRRRSFRRRGGRSFSRRRGGRRMGSRLLRIGHRM